MTPQSKATWSATKGAAPIARARVVRSHTDAGARALSLAAPAALAGARRARSVRHIGRFSDVRPMPRSDAKKVQQHCQCDRGGEGEPHRPAG